MSDLDQVAIDANYELHGVEAELVPGSGGDAITVTVIDETRGVEVSGGGIDISTVVPAVCIRMSELVENDLDVDDMIDSVVTVNGRTWRSRNNVPIPTLSGEDGGELRLLLSSETT